MNFEVLTMVPIVGAGGSPEVIFLSIRLLFGTLQSEQPNRKALTEGLCFFWLHVSCFPL
jgi:hypothetical protein